MRGWWVDALEVDGDLPRQFQGGAHQVEQHPDRVVPRRKEEGDEQEEKVKVKMEKVQVVPLERNTVVVEPHFVHDGRCRHEEVVPHGTGDGRQVAASRRQVVDHVKDQTSNKEEKRSINNNNKYE
jgi:hypothetical protein